MLKILLKTIMSGPRATRDIGIHLVPDDEAQRLVDAHFAEFLDKKGIEKAIITPEEKAVVIPAEKEVVVPEEKRKGGATKQVAPPEEKKVEIDTTGWWGGKQ